MYPQSMRSSSRILVLLVSILLGVLIVPSTHGHGGDLHGHGDHCWVDDVTPAEMARDEARMKRIQKTEAGRRQLQKLSCNEVCDQCIEIDTYFHFMSLTAGGGTPAHPSESVELLLAGGDGLSLDDFTTVDGMIDIVKANIAYTNNQLVGTPFKLNFIDTDVTVDSSEAAYVFTPLNKRGEMSAKFGKGDLRVLDVFLSYALLTEDEAAMENPPLRVGTSSLPSQQLELKSDGIFLRYDTLTGGGLTPFDEGVTLTHELGHWLGLYHTFQTVDNSESCENAPNDYIDDTAAHVGDSADIDCAAILKPDDTIDETLLPDTCPSLPGSDPVFNYMNYVRDDNCHTRAGSFSCNQIERMYYQWILYRDEVSACPDGQFEFEFSYTFDTDHVRDNRIVIYKNRGESNEEIIFDTDNDHDDGAIINQEVLAVDLCLFENANHQFEITDATGDGFASGTAKVDVFKDTVLLETITGNFGEEFTVDIPATATSAPTSSPMGTDTEQPTNGPTFSPTSAPTAAPTFTPTSSPTKMPTTLSPTGTTAQPTSGPTVEPTAMPTSSPTKMPSTLSPTDTEPTTAQPTSGPTSSPTAVPTSSPTKMPTTLSPTGTEPTTAQPTSGPTSSPTSTPTSLPTKMPTTVSPTRAEPTTPQPSSAPLTAAPTSVPTFSPPVVGLPTRSPSEDTISDIIENDPNLTFLNAAVDALDLSGDLSGPIPLVLLAPIDQAFQEFSQLYPELAAVLFDTEWVAHLRELVTFHATLEQFAVSALGDGFYRFETVAGGAFQIVVTAGTPTITPTIAVTPAEILNADIAASNGFVSIVDSFLRPDFLTIDLIQYTENSFPNFFALLVDIGLDDVIRVSFGLTIFVPNDRALEGLMGRRLQGTRRDLNYILSAQIVMDVVPTELIPQGFSTLQSLAGTTLRVARRDPRISVNGFPIRQADILVSNGIIHVVDQLFLAPRFPQPKPPPPPPKRPPPPPSKGKGGKGKGWKGGAWMMMGNYGMMMGYYGKPQSMGYSAWMRYRKPQRQRGGVFMGMMWRP